MFRWPFKAEDAAAKPERMFVVEGLPLRLTDDHALPTYQASHIMYDRFLPQLARQLKSETSSIIIDVGANVGDTAFAFIPYCENRILCIEGLKEYFDVLEENVDRNGLGGRISCIHALVGTGKFEGDLIGDGTTATRAANGGRRSVSLDQLLEDAGLSGSRVDVLKIDTDGFDGDVIASGACMINRDKPLIFWENYFANDLQRASLEEAYLQLRQASYNHIWVFDNFGNPILNNCSLEVLPSINSYMTRQDRAGATRTFYYTDVLAATDAHAEIAAAAVMALEYGLINRS